MPSAIAGSKNASSVACGLSASALPAECGMRYSQFIAGLQRAMVELDRKSLSEVAIHDPDTFTKLVELARQNMPAGLK